MNDKQFETLLENIKNKKLGNRLVLDEALFSIDHCKALCKALEQDSAIESVILKGFQMMHDEVLSIIKAIETNETITYIDLSGNCITNKGAEELAKILEHNTSIRYIDISSNSIGEEGKKLLANTLKKHPNIADVYGVGRDNELESYLILSKIKAILNTKFDKLNEKQKSFIYELCLDEHKFNESFQDSVYSQKDVELFKSFALNIKQQSFQKLLEDIEGNKLKKFLSFDNKYLSTTQPERGKEINAIIKALEKNTIITSIDLKNSNMEKASLQGLLNVLRTHPSITEINGIEIDDELEFHLTSNRIKAMLNTEFDKLNDKQKIFIYELYLDENEFSQRFKDSVYSQKDIELFKSFALNIKQQGFQKLLEDIEGNKHTKSLNFDNKYLSTTQPERDKEVNAITKALEKNTIITFVDLKNNNIGKESLQELLNVFKTNPNIAEIDGIEIEDKELFNHITFNKIKNIAAANFDDLQEKQKDFIKDIFNTRSKFNEVLEKEKDHNKRDKISEIFHDFVIKIDEEKENLKTEFANQSSFNNQPQRYWKPHHHTIKITEPVVKAEPVLEKGIADRISEAVKHFALEPTEAIEKMLQAIEKNTKITSINILQGQVETAAKFLKHNTTIFCLELPGIYLNTNATKLIADALEQNNVINQLNLAETNIDDEGALALFKAINKRDVSTRIIVNQCNFGKDEVINEIIKALENNKIISLDIGGNNISKKNLIRIFKALESNTSLISFSLFKTLINEETAIEFAKSLEKNITLETIDLYATSMNEKSIKIIIETLKKHPGIVNIEGIDADKELENVMNFNKTRKQRNSFNDIVSAASTEFDKLNNNQKKFIYNMSQTKLDECLNFACKKDVTLKDPLGLIADNDHVYSKEEVGEIQSKFENLAAKVKEDQEFMKTLNAPSPKVEGSATKNAMNSSLFIAN